MKKVLISLLIILNISSVSFAQSLYQKIFEDVPTTHPHHTAIRFLAENGIVSGYQDGTFKPDNTINRAEVLKIILKGSNIDSTIDFSQEFPDVNEGDWFAPFVLKAKNLGIVKGNENDGTFTPSREVNLAEFLKMLLEANQIDTSMFKDSSTDWFTQYINYGKQFGLVEGNAPDPGKQLTRSEVANMMYLLTLTENGTNTQFLLTRAETELAQTEIFLMAKMPLEAKKSSLLSIDLTQKALLNIPDNNIVLGAAKLAKAYNYVVNSYIFALNNETQEAANWANQAIDKASEAWEVNIDTEPIAKHIKDLAREILKQINAEET